MMQCRCAGLLVAAVVIIAALAASCAPSRETQLSAGRHNNLGVALMDHGHFEDATKEFDEALALHEGLLPARVNLGIARYYEGNYDEAESAFNEAIARDPVNIRAHYMLGARSPSAPVIRPRSISFPSRCAPRGASRTRTRRWNDSRSFAPRCRGRARRVSATWNRDATRRPRPCL